MIQSKKNILLIHRHEKNDWSFPKGHIEHSETDEQATIREVREETGYAIQILIPLPKFIYQTGDDKHVEVTMFLAEPSGKPAEPENGSMIEWIPLTEVEKKLSYENLREYWRSASQLISR